MTDQIIEIDKFHFVKSMRKPLKPKKYISIGKYTLSISKEMMNLLRDKEKSSDYIDFNVDIYVDKEKKAILLKKGTSECIKYQNHVGHGIIKVRLDMPIGKYAYKMLYPGEGWLFRFAVENQ